MCEVVFQHHSEAREKKSSPTYLFSVCTEGQILINSVSAVLFIITPDSDVGEIGKSPIFYTMV